jgi:hypothetical protein
MGDIFSVDVAIRGKGLGQLIAYLMRAFTFGDREDSLKKIHQDWLKKNKLFNKYKDLYGELPKY